MEVVTVTQTAEPYPGAQKQLLHFSVAESTQKGHTAMVKINKEQILEKKQQRS